MTAYVIADVEVTNAAKFNEYRSHVPPTIKKYGGEYIVRGGTTEKAEGNWDPSRIVIIQFGSMDQAKRWYHSKEYSGLLQLRRQSANTNVLFVEGV